MSYLLLGVGLVVGLALALYGFANANPRKLAKTLKIIAIVIGIAILLLVVFTGRVAMLLGMLPFLLPFLMRSRALWQRLRSMAGPSPGQASSVRTDTLEMTLDHDTGQMTGTVRHGPFAGRTLHSLSRNELIALYTDCQRRDPQSASIIETFLDREHGTDWRDDAAGAGYERGESHGSRARSSAGPMTVDEAYEVLDLEPGASADEIRAAYRRLMGKLHPDHGGSGYLAAKLNQARDILLGGKG